METLLSNVTVVNFLQGRVQDFLDQGQISFLGKRAEYLIKTKDTSFGVCHL